MILSSSQASLSWFHAPHCPEQARCMGTCIPKAPLLSSRSEHRAWTQLSSLCCPHEVTVKILCVCLVSLPENVMPAPLALGCGEGLMCICAHCH